MRQGASPRHADLLCASVFCGAIIVAMTEENEPRLTSISKARTLDEIAEFWDTHSLADYWDQTHEVEFEVRAPRKAGSPRTIFVSKPSCP